MQSKFPKVKKVQGKRVVEFQPVTYLPWDGKETCKQHKIAPCEKCLVTVNGRVYFAYSGDAFTVEIVLVGEAPNVTMERFTETLLQRKISYVLTYIGGDDGYRVPRSFAEFESQEPHYIRRWVQKKLRRNSADDDVLDWESDLSLHMRYLPETSIGREAGYNEANPNGCIDLVQCFNPYRNFGSSKRRFLSYINNCLSNRFSTIHSKNLKNPVMRDGNMTYDPTATAEEMAEHPGLGGEEYIHANSASQRERLHKKTMATEHSLFLSAFRDFVNEHEPTLEPMLRAIAETETQEEAQNQLGITAQVFHHNKKRLKVLAECFKDGDDIPVWRKYKRHEKTEVASIQ